MSALDAVFAPDVVAAFAELVERVVDERLEQRLAETNARAASEPESPYLTVPEAADYLRCRRQRIDDLLSARVLMRHKDGAGR